MAQRSIPVRAGETAVTAALRIVADLIPAAVTSSYRPGGTSLHKTGRAVDLASLAGPTWDSPELLAINKRILELIPLHMISELIYGGEGGVCVKNGRIVDGWAVYGREVMRDHRDHCHLAVVPTFRFNAPQEAPAVSDPNIHPAYAEVVNLVVTPSGNGYYIICADGAVYAFGDARYFGRVEVKK